MTTLLDWDYAIFNAINHGLANGFLDAIMPHWRAMEFWFPFYALFIFFLFTNFPWRKALIVFIFLLMTIGIVDSIGNYGLKKTVKRPRPCKTTEYVEARALVKCSNGFSFASNHAANHGAIATFLIVSLGFISRYFNFFLVFWALSIGLGQIYVGVHYPLDVLVGFILGTSIGFLMGTLSTKVVRLQPVKTEL